MKKLIVLLMVWALMIFIFCIPDALGWNIAYAISQIERGSLIYLLSIGITEWIFKEDK